MPMKSGLLFKPAEVGVAQQREALALRVGGVFECCQVFLWQWFGLRQCNAQWVLMDAGDFEFVMKMRPRCPTGCADIADDLSLAHTRPAARTRRESRHVPIERGDAAAMADFDHVAVAAFCARVFDDAIRCCPDRRAARRGEIDTGVLAPIFQ